MDVTTPTPSAMSGGERPPRRRTFTSEHEENGSLLQHPRAMGQNMNLPSSVITRTSLDDVKGAFETEAETAIIEAIEQDERERAAEANDLQDPLNSGPAILDGVPASAVHLFTHNEEDEVHTPLFNRNDAREAVEPMEPTATASPSLKDITNRMMMMKRITKMRTVRNLGSTIDEAPEAEHEIDPESLLDVKNDIYEKDPESATPEQLDETNHNESSGRDSKRSKKACCRRYCGLCHTLRRLIGVRKANIKYNLKMFMYLTVPLLCLSGILFYFAGNPMGSGGASLSWWLLFVIRLAVTFLLAQMSQFILIDYIALETRLAVRSVGRMLTLMAMQARGWPLILVFWSLWNIILNQGSSPHAQHWLHMQNFIGLFNKNNPSGDIISNPLYESILGTSIFVGVALVVKRVAITYMFGRKQYLSYGAKTESMMRKVLLVGEVASLAEDLEFGAGSQHGIVTGTLNPNSPWILDKFKSRTERDNEEEEDDDAGDDDDDSKASGDLYQVKSADNEEEEEEVKKSFLKKNIQWKGFQVKKNKANKKSLLNNSEQIAMESLLGEWEEPETKKKLLPRDTSIRKILQFRESIKYLGTSYPLSVPFGLAETRRQCMKSAQTVYSRLMLDSPEAQVLHFDTIMTLAIDKHGKLQKDKARALIRLFRPDREGNLTLLDFVRSCDAVYRKVKMFRVTTTNAVQLDEAFEKLLNGVYYFVMALISVSLLGVNPMALFTALTGIFLPLSFLFSSAASKYFEGLLLVLVRQPYDIGDRIALSNPTDDTNADGSVTWFVEHITLFTTTVRNASTNEVATYANSSLSNVRIVNAARSPKAIVSVKLKFGTDVSFQKIKVFGNVVETFVKDRPREWIKPLGFRQIAVEADMGYVQYIVIMQHVEAWQNIGAIKQSLADVASFCLEVSKKMNMRFISPPMPVDLRFEDIPSSSFLESLPKVANAPPKGRHSRNSSELPADGGYQFFSNLFDADPSEEKKKR